MTKSDSAPTVTSGKNNPPGWIKVTNNAGWRPRDSQGELVYKDRLWILGGWFSNEESCPSDVWSSSDGKRWKLVTETAQWKHGDLPMTLVFEDKMWFMGGWYNGMLPDHSASSEVWMSSDGIRWQQATQSAEWTPRLAAGAVVFKGKMWILGGLENYRRWLTANPKSENDLKNDVWSSADGKKWQLTTNKAGWSPRAFHRAVVFEGRIWVFGGCGPERKLLNDVWCSEDGVKWSRVTPAAPWGPRKWFSSIVYRNRVWVLGGFHTSTSPTADRHLNFSDVWYSKDGENWNQMKSEPIWSARHAHSTLVFEDKIWVVGGKRDVLNLKAPTANIEHDKALVSEVWSLHIPENWFNDE